MRVSSNTQYIMGTYNLQSKGSQLNRLNEQLSTLKRINRASDDPVAAATLVDINQSKSMNTQQSSNAKAAASQLAITDTILGNVSNTIISIKTLAVQAGNTVLTNEDRQAIQNEMREKVKELVSLANTTDGASNYIFGGTDKSKPPFTMAVQATPPQLNINYQGNDQRQYMAISSSREIAVTEPGSVVFGRTSTPAGPAPAGPGTAGNELWQSLSVFDEALSAGSVDPNYATNIATALQGLDDGLSQVLASRASLGSRMQETDSLIEMGDALSVQYASQISNLEDLDLAKAVSDFEMARTALEVTQKTFAQVKSLSLFNYL
ncbi:flagellar hook-associated protein FlgL [Vogesella indigofera]|uniref:flagellar hook-associated protein FlgL n=1 Tax=Vogesella indigofera TaxID=45465 RepID=UPI00234E66BD|nr:flagellar hook-associated protein FlgL [Vogesella indigofera]MDC7710315.1 flagellar hook-associated protein FlgL [Vogesella indigofera]